MCMWVAFSVWLGPCATIEVSVAEGAQPCVSGEMCLQISFLANSGSRDTRNHTEDS